jgi:Rrf2 family protein
MLSLTRKTDYALIALCHMAHDPEGCCSAREIATRYRVPLPLLLNILKLLTRRGFAKSARGPRGGYTLAMPAEEITLYDVIQAVEGPVQLVQCVEYKQARAEGNAGLGCGLMSSCPVYSPIQLVHNRLVEFLSGVTLADVVNAPGCKSTVQLATVPGDSCSEAADIP